MDGGGNNSNEESFSKRLEQDTSQEFMISSSHIEHSNPTNYHPTSLNLSIPVRQLYHEQAKSIVAIQELQNEVSSLLEFKNALLETFPHLHNRFGGSVSPSSGGLAAPTPIPGMGG
jgi:hypothetical protein